MIKQRRTLTRYMMASLIVLLCALVGNSLQAKSKIDVAATSGLQLIMFEQEGCHYCDLWDTNIGGFYHKTPEGKFAPLKKVDIHYDNDIPNVNPVVFTPTFVLYKNGHEVGRLTGYISDDFFWGLLKQLLVVHGFENKKLKKEVSGLKGRIK